MKTANTHIAPSTRKFRALVLLGAVAAVMITIACSSKPKTAGNVSMPAGASVRPAALQTVVSQATPVEAKPVSTAKKISSPVKPSERKLIAYRSRDYGVSFLYPWQYAFLNAKAVANGDSALRPKSDGHDGQFTLARVEIPQGFYSETDYESGYFILSLNQDLSEEECESVLNAEKDGKLETETINGIGFRWMETDSGGHGESARLRQYVAFANGTCYELEMGVKTRNEDGLAREVDPEQVLRRLDAILRTVKILPDAAKPATTVVESSSAVAAPVSQQ